MVKKKVQTIRASLKANHIDKENIIPITRQCQLIGIARSSLYYKGKPMTAKNKKILHEIDEIYTSYPCYGTRRIKVELRRRSLKASRPKISRYMKLLGIEAIYPKKNLSKRNAEHKIYPYLLRNKQITHKNQVWSSDITYIRQSGGGFVYLVAIIDWHTRYVLSWNFSVTLDSKFCQEALEEAIVKHGTPEIFNTDQGSQFTDSNFVNILKRNGIAVSMNGKGRALDNVFVERLWRSLKVEEVYIKDYQNISDCKRGISNYFKFYNFERPHQSLNYKTPYEEYFGLTYPFKKIS